MHVGSNCLIAYNFRKFIKQFGYRLKSGILKRFMSKSQNIISTIRSNIRQELLFNYLSQIIYEFRNLFRAYWIPFNFVTKIGRKFFILNWKSICACFPINCACPFNIHEKSDEKCNRKKVGLSARYVCRANNITLISILRLSIWADLVSWPDYLLKNSFVQEKKVLSSVIYSTIRSNEEKN